MSKISRINRRVVTAVTSSHPAAAAPTNLGRGGRSSDNRY
jgi:hypothetical protein